MRSFFRFPSRLRRKSAAAFALWSVSAAMACGPEFPNSYYAMPERELLEGPQGFFAAEIARFAPRDASVLRAVRAAPNDSRASTLEIDVAEVRQALILRGVPRSDDITSAYAGIRRRLETWIEHTRTSRSSPGAVPPRAPDFTLPVEVPMEFRLYLEAAVAWHGQRFDEARVLWQAVLALPAEERSFRTVWSSFMLGRLELQKWEHSAPRDPEELARTYRAARHRFQATRDYVAKGSPDPLGLAAASLGWEARAALVARDYVTAIGLYVEQHATGDDSALVSLRRAARAAVESVPRDFAALARAPEARRVITAYFIARGVPRSAEDEAADDLDAWVRAIESAGVTVLPEADRLAWLAYDAGLFAPCERWVALARPDSPEANWIRAKLALRRGQLERGEELLRATFAAQALDEAHRMRVAAELSRVCLARDDYKGALAAALAGRHWEDAAYVAERVMSLAELKDFVDALPLPEPPLRSNWGEADLRWRLRHLLARRLARSARAAEAGVYFPPEWREVFERHATDLQLGFDQTRSAAERAQAFWRAAQRVRADGMHLLGTELDPDWAIWGGDYPAAAAAPRRTQLTLAGGAFAPTSEERQRLEAQRVPEKRFHYRYRAAELAWWAASLLPNDSDETAHILASAGGWLKSRDPRAAEPFYQALVIRCGATELGKAAAKARWFPPAEAVANSKL